MCVVDKFGSALNPASNWQPNDTINGHTHTLITMNCLAPALILYWATFVTNRKALIYSQTQSILSSSMFDQIQADIYITLLPLQWFNESTSKLNRHTIFILQYLIEKKRRIWPNWLAHRLTMWYCRVEFKMFYSTFTPSNESINFTFIL